MKKLINFEDFMTGKLQDMELAELYLKEALEEDDPLIFQKCLSQVLKAQCALLKKEK